MPCCWFNLAAWCWAFVAFHRFPVLLGTAFLAYSFGLRHAVDADHIAAIDNVTRKLMQQGKRPVAVGLMFSLGHSTIVVVGSIAIAAAALALQHRIDAVTGDRRRHRHAGVGSLSVRHRDRQSDRSAVGVSQLSCACGAGSPTWKRTSTCCWAIAAFFRACFAPCST